MKEIALVGAAGPIYNAVLSTLLHDNRAVEALVTNPSRMMLNSSKVNVARFRWATVAEIRDELTGYDTVVVAYNTDFTDAANNEFVRHTYARTVNGAIAAGVKRLIVVGSKVSEAFFCGEIARHKGTVDAVFVSTEGDFATAVVGLVAGVDAAVCTS